ncbi:MULTISPECIES: helix-turn-helix domain-containing protein [unclassified Nocardia]|uniref:helix-turn-helix domain-containing protein n=1 Tax=unclassified Nocardia TaxID=2637762 RepID=UPI001CE4AC5A|nr:MULTISPECIES: helix-turn-helix domain-containing protein [unclassified Nocardia]
MAEPLYSVDQVAERLGLHVRTVRNYVRDGRLKAVRIGKQYRIAQSDLEAFTGGPVPAAVRETVARQRHSEVSAIVEVDAIDRELASRLALLVTGAANGGNTDQPLRVQTGYDEERGRMKVIILGGLADTARLLEYMEGVLDT